MEGKLTAFRGIIMLMLMMCAVLVAKAQGDAVTKQKPCIYIGLNGKEGYGDTGKSEKATYLNDTKFIEPAITVYESTPCVILAVSGINKGKDEDYNGLEGGEIFGD